MSDQDRIAKLLELERIRRAKIAGPALQKLSADAEKKVVDGVLLVIPRVAASLQIVELERRCYEAVLSAWVDLRKELIAVESELGTADSLQEVRGDCEQFLRERNADRALRYQQHYWKLLYADGSAPLAPLDVLLQQSKLACQAVLSTVDFLLNELQLSVETGVYPPSKETSVVNIENNYGIVNTGQIAGDVLNVINQLKDTGKPQAADALRQLTELVTSAPELAEKQQELLEQIKYVGNQAALPEPEREKGMLKSVLGGISSALSVASSAVTVWPAVEPVLKAILGL